MTIEQARFETIVDQRPYYSMVLIDRGNYTLDEYWKQIGTIINPGKQIANLIYTDLEIQHRRLKSNFAYPRGKLLEEVSAKKDGLAPYYYDLFTVRTVISGQIYFILAYPFAALARTVIDSLIAGGNLLKKSDMMKVEVPRLIEHGDIARGAGDIRSRIAGLKVVIADDPDLASLAITGDNPLKSLIYKEFMEESIRRGSFIPNECVLACELNWPIAMSDEPTRDQRKIRARMHIDPYGSFKFYCHLSGANLVVIPYLLRQLVSINCLRSTSVNPFRRIQDEGEY